MKLILSTLALLAFATVTVTVTGAPAHAATMPDGTPDTRATESSTDDQSSDQSSDQAAAAKASDASTATDDDAESNSNPAQADTRTPAAQPEAAVAQDTAPAVEVVKPQPQIPEATAPAAATAAAPEAAPTRVREAKPELAGDLRAPSPKALDPNRRGFFQLGVGPAYGAGLQSDSLMYDVIGSYNFNLSDEWTVKALGDLAMATGSVSSRIYDFGVGAEYYIPDLKVAGATPYLAADIGVAFGRNALEETATGAALGAGAGVKFAAADLNFDLNAHYEQMTAEVGDAAPAIFAVRGSVAF